MSNEILDLGGANDPEAIEEITQKREEELKKIKEETEKNAAEAPKKLKEKLRILSREGLAEDKTDEKRAV